MTTAYQLAVANTTLDLQASDLWPWMEQAECSRDAYSDERDAAVRFFTELAVTQQKAICADCPVRPECVRYAIDVEGPRSLRGLDDMVYGGLTGAEIVAGRRRAAWTPPIPVARPILPKTGEPCPVTDGDWLCPNRVHARGMCKSHRMQLLRGGLLRKFAPIGGLRIKGQQAAA